MMRRFSALLTALLCLLTVLPMAEASAQDVITSVEQLNRAGISLGTELGCAADLTIREKLPEAKLEFYNDKLLGYTDVANGKLDAFIYDRRQMELAIKAGLQGVRLLDTALGEPVRIAAGISPVSTVPDLENRLNEFIAGLRADGTLDDMFMRWVINGDESMPAIELPKDPDFHLTVGTSGVVPPYSYYVGTELNGYDIELAYRFALWLGADLQLKVYDYGAIVSAAVSGDVDCIMANLNITAERAEVLTFSDILYEEQMGVMVKGEGPVSSENSAPAPMGGKLEETATPSKDVRWQDYNGKRLGVLIGPVMEDVAKEFFPDSEYLFFNSYPDCIAALLSGKIDAYLGDEPELKSAHAEQPEIDYIHERLTQNNYSFAFRKNDPKSAELCEELNAFLAACRVNGSIQELEDIWFGTDESRKVVDMTGLTGENGTIRVVTTSTDMPYSYIKDGKNVGYDIDLVTRFCREKGYALELGDVDVAARIPAVQSGKYDFTTDMNVTPEREEQVLFSDPTRYGGIVLAVPAKDLDTANAGQPESTGLEKLKASFNKTFLRENRWQLFVNGIFTTLMITLLTILFGTALGFAMFMLCRNGNPVANDITRFCLWLVQGMPMVVLLMILYYLVFASVAISGIAVAVIGFTLTFGAAVYGLLKMGVGAVDNGQYEAAYALGYSGHRTFFKIILPQALPHVLPAYKGEIVGLIKATAVVGYIAVQDLTKMGDIVRSRTYEAFFPLIAVTVIYFLLEGLIGFAVSRVAVVFDPRHRKPATILKGVKTDD